MKKWILGLGAFALAFAMTIAPTDAKVMAAESTTVSAGDTTGSGGNTGKNTESAVPTGLTWDDSWNAKWNAVEGVKRYTIQLYRNGDTDSDMSWIASSAPVDGICTFNLNRYIDDSGTYTFKVWGGGTEGSAFSAGKEYIRPEKQLGTVVGYWDRNQHGIFNVPVLEGVKEYEWWLECNKLDEDMRGFWTVTADDVKNGILQKDIYSLLGEKNGLGRCEIVVRPISEDINTVASGIYTFNTEEYDLSLQVANVNDIIIEKIQNASTAAEAMGQIRSNIPRVNLLFAMQNNVAVRSIIADLEQKYVTEREIDFGKTEVSEAAGAYVKAEEISLVGAGLSGRTGKTVKLEISVPEKKEGVSAENYSKSVQLDIKLKSDTKDIETLNIPVTITMKAPKGIDAKNLVIFQYYADGRYERVFPLINEDGTITFTVTRFTSFVFAETVSDGKGDAIGGENIGEDTTNNDNKTAEEVSNIIADAMASGSVVNALNTILGQVSINEISVAMQTDDNVLSQMKDLEAKYIAETGVTAILNADAVKGILDISKVSVVGAALNGVAGSKMSLDIAVPEKTVDVDKKYADTVQLDIKLTNNGTSVSELKVPITITIPVPNSLKDRDIDHLTLLHYSSVDGSHEEVKFKDNGDGTVTFTVTHFSTFVFATEENADTSNDDDSNEDDNNDDSNDESNEEVKATAVPVKDSVPKTGDSFPVGMLMIALVCMLGAVVVRKRA